MHSARKFSQVLGHRLLNSSNMIRPAGCPLKSMSKKQRVFCLPFDSAKLLIDCLVIHKIWVLLLFSFSTKLTSKKQKFLTKINRNKKVNFKFLNFYLLEKTQWLTFETLRSFAKLIFLSLF